MRAVRALVLVALVLAVAWPAQASTRTTQVNPAASVVSTPPLPVLTSDPLPVGGLFSTRIHWTRWSTRVVYGGRTLLEGQVVTSDGALPDAPVDLLARPAGSNTWRHVDSATSSSGTGVFRFAEHEPGATTDYRVEYDGSLLYAASSGSKQVPVARRVRDRLAKAADGIFVFSGSVAPSYRDRKVVLQRRTCGGCDWRAVKTTHTSSTSRWKFRLSAPTSRGTWYYRTKVPADARFVRSFSDHVVTLTRR